MSLITLTGAESGAKFHEQYFTTNYSPKMYGAFPQNWGICEDQRGIIYVANNEGVLEYDGSSWRKYSIGGNSLVRSLAVDSDGRLYAGGRGEFGYFQPAGGGTLEYISLSDSLNAADHAFTDIWKILVLDDMIYFYSKELLFRYIPGYGVRSVPLEKGYHFAFQVRDKIYIGHYEKGLTELHQNDPVVIKGGDFFSGKNIFAVLPYGNDKLLIVTFISGNYIVDPTTGSVKLFGNSPNQFTGRRFYHGIRMQNGNYAFASLQDGVIIADADGNIIANLNKSNGLQDETALYLFEPSQKSLYPSLWIALNQGISKVNINNPLTNFNSDPLLKGTILDITFHNQELYVATSSGVFTYDSKSQQFLQVDNIESQAWKFLAAGSRLYAGCTTGIWEIDGTKARSIREVHYSYAMSPSEIIDGLVYIGTVKGVSLALTDGDNLKYLGRIAGIGDEVRSIAETGDGSIWCGTLDNGLYRIHLDRNRINSQLQYADLDSIPELVLELSHYTETSGLPVLNDLQLYLHKTHLLVAGLAGLYEYDQNADRFVRAANYPDELVDGNKAVFRYAADLQDREWISVSDARGESVIALQTENKVKDYIFGDLGMLPQMSVQAIYPDQNHRIWIGGTEGLYLFDTRKIKTDPYLFQALIRRVTCMPDSVLYNGTGIKKVTKNEFDTHVKYLVQSEPGTDQQPILNYANNSLTFQYASPYFSDETALKYRYILDGFDKNWSAWTSETKKEYTNIYEGTYTFRVEAMNSRGDVSAPGSYTFTILPPWYRTPWMYLLYGLSAILVIYVITQLYTYRLRQQKARLEQIVLERTAQIREQKEIIELEKDKSDKLLLNILPVKVANDLKHTNKTEPESFPNVTVYFSDVVGFTNLSTTLEPKLLISELNDIFTAFDNIMEKHHCERIKTIGDAYMAVCGMPEPNPEHAPNIVDAALEIRDYLTERNRHHELQWRIRIGVHTGKLVGGVVGIKKYIYDVFGDTVNTASRMESNSEAMRINISQTTWNIIKDDYEFEPRPPLAVKGKGEMNMYFVIGKK